MPIPANRRPAKFSESIIGKSSYRLVLIGVVLLFYGALTGLWLISGPAYTRVMAVWAVRTVTLPYEGPIRNPVPFVDMASVLSWRECRVSKIPTQAAAACKLGGEPNYPPLWLYLPLEWIGLRHLALAGLTLGAAFLASLFYLMRPRDGPEFAVAAAACLSHVTVFAVERANVDLLMFLLMLAALCFWRRQRSAASFGLIMIGGFLKLYPFALLLMLARERLRAFAGFAVAAFLIGLLYLAWKWNYFSHLGQMVPHVYYFSSMFGAVLLPMGIVDMLGLPAFAIRLLLAPVLLAGLWAASRLAERHAHALADIRWTGRRMSGMLGGSVITFACFMMGGSVDYRAIFLLPVLPGLMALRREAQDRDLSRLLSFGVAAILFSLYSEMVRVGLLAGLTALLGHVPESPLEIIPLMLCFLLRESVWWFIFVLLGTIILSFLRQSPALREAGAFLSHDRRPA